MKIFPLIFLLLLFVPFFANSQAFINGSFENTTATGCTYNLNNAAFNSRMSNVFAYGAGNETDIMVSGCYVPSIPDGTFCIALAAPTSDEVAIELASPLVAGMTYTFTFYAYSDIQFRVQGDVEIGASTNNSSFGSLIYTAVTIPNNWIQYSVTFVAPNNTTHITARNIAGATHWNRIDAFEFITLLPVDVAELKGVLNGDQIDLTWQTLSEVNSDFFVVEHSMDAISWADLTTLDAAGQSSQPINYQTEDIQPHYGMNYYRFRQVDFSGNKTYSNTIAIDYQPLKNETIRVYPNPTEDRVVIDFNASESGNLELRVFDIWGRELLHQTAVDMKVGANHYDLDLSHFSPGVYMIKLANDRFGYKVQKIVKSK